MPTNDLNLYVARAVLDLAHRPEGFDPLELLHDLTAQAVALLPVRCAGITVRNEQGQVVYVTASDMTCAGLEEDQIELDEGPCLDSVRTEQSLPLTLLTSPWAAERWPRFTFRARRVGIRAVAAVRLPLPHMTFGALNLMMAGPPYVTSRDLELADVLAKAAAVALTHQRLLAGRDEVVAQLQTALDSRLVIEQAKGVLSATLNVSVDEAFTRLRAHARARGQKLTVLSTRIALGDIPHDLVPAP
ncbi:ANTAR domain-containing protein [Streptomyces sp. cg35]|uniref:ANTAR domain-containing protein n=1 Tax=Streptomyces sp. cg35 TaxID=3421650 RepID=UPI003D17ABCE